MSERTTYHEYGGLSRHLLYPAPHHLKVSEIPDDLLVGGKIIPTLSGTASSRPIIICPVPKQTYIVVWSGVGCSEYPHPEAGTAELSFEPAGT